MVDRLENVLREDHNVCTINLQKGSNQFKKTKWVTKYLIYLPAKLSLVFSSHSDSYDFRFFLLNVLNLMFSFSFSPFSFE